MSSVLSRLNLVKREPVRVGTPEVLVEKLASGIYVAGSSWTCGTTSSVDGFDLSVERNPRSNRTLARLVRDLGTAEDGLTRRVIADLSINEVDGIIDGLSFTTRFGLAVSIYDRNRAPNDVLSVMASSIYAHQNEVHFSCARIGLSVRASFDSSSGLLLSGTDYSYPDGNLSADGIKRKLDLPADRLDVIATISQILTGSLSFDGLSSSLRFSSD